MTENQPRPVTTEVATGPRRRLGCLWIILALIGLLFVAVVFFALFALGGAPLKISQETTYILGPLKSDGKQVDYFVAWEQETYPEAIATDDSGYRLIVQHLGASPKSTPRHFARVCQKLGLDSEAIVPDMTLEEPFSFLQAYVASADFDPTLVDRLLGEEVAEGLPADEESSEDRMAGHVLEPATVLELRLGRPWTLDDLPMMEAWLADNNPAIDLISEAVRKPVFHIPYSRTTEDDMLLTVLLPDVQYVRSFARALSARAHYRIGTGDIDGAIDDIVACKRLGRHVGYNVILVEMLVGIAIEGIADSIGIAGSLEHPPTKDRLERLVSELNDLPAAGEFSKAMLFERYALLDIVQSMAHGNESLLDLDIPGWMLRMSLDWNVIARRVNAQHDTLLASGRYPTPSPHLKAIISTRVRSELLADILGAFLLPATDAAREAARRRQCVERMHRVNLAMLLYESDHGTLPPAFTVDSDGNPLHSWRVVLLPYLDQQTLYDKIRLDEPWNSEHNRKLHGEAVAFYQCPSAALAPGQTTYSVAVGPEMPFDGSCCKKLAAFGPKSAAMILVVERTPPVCWMDPTRDVPQGLADAGINVHDGRGDEIASPHPAGANFGLRSGACRFLSEMIDPAVFKGLLRGAVEDVP
jgi:hypothetical protein